LVLGLFHDLPLEVSKLCVNPAICLDVNEPVEIVSLRHSRTAAICRKKAQSFDQSVSGSVAEVGCEVIWRDSPSLLDVFFWEHLPLLRGEEVWVELQVTLREKLVGGEGRRGFEGVADIVTQNPKFATCITQKMLTYSLGRLLTDTDNPYLDLVNSAWLKDPTKASIPALVHGLVSTETFRSRRGGT